MAIKITPYQKNAGGTLDEYKFASTGSIVDLNGYTPYADSELDNIPDIAATDNVNTATKKLDGKIRKLDNDKADTDHTHSYAGSASAGGAATAAVKLETARGIDGVQFDGSTAIVHYGTCATAAATAAKTVDCVGFNLVTGSRIAVKFTVTNTASNPTLNVSGTGAKSIFYHNTNIDKSILESGRVYEFIYDGTQYQLVGDLNTDTDTKYTGSDGIALTGTNFTNSGVRSVATGETAGTISVNTNGTAAEVSVAGLKSGAFNDTYVHPTTAGNKHIPAGGAEGQILKYSESGTAVWANESDTRYTGSDGIILTGTNFTNSGVRSISAGATNGTISVNTNGTSAEVAVAGLGSAAYTNSTDYATATHNQASNTINAMTGYTKPDSSSAITASDTLNIAVGKLEKALDDKQETLSVMTASEATTGTGTAARSISAKVLNDKIVEVADAKIADIDTGVMAVTSGTVNGTISVDGTDVSVTGLQSGAFADAYVHPTTAGNKHIPTGGSTGQILKYSASGTAAWADEYSYTHPTTAGNKHIPSGGETGQVLKYAGTSGEAAWSTLVPADIGALASDGTAVKAVADASGNTITTTYATKAEVSTIPKFRIEVVASLPATGVEATVYLVKTSDESGNLYTEYIYVNNAWEELGTQALDLSNYALKSDITTGSANGNIAVDGTDVPVAGLRSGAFADAYVHPTTEGNKHIPAGGSSGQILKYSAAGTAAWADEYSYTHPASGVTADTYGPSANVTGNEGTTITVPEITVDAQGHITDVTERTYTSKDTTYSAMTAAEATTGTATDARTISPKVLNDKIVAVADAKIADINTGVMSVATGTANGTIAVDGTDVAVKGLQSGAYATAYVHPDSGVTADSYGPTANVTGTEGTTLAVPQITVDAKGHITGVTERTYTSKDTTYEAGTKALLDAGADTVNRVWNAKAVSDYVTGYVAGEIGNINTGVMSVATGTANGTLSVDGTDVSVAGLQSGAFAAAYSHPTTSGNKHIPSGGSSGQILKWSADGTAVWENEVTYDVFGASGADASNGLVPAPPTTAGTTKYLREDGTWQAPPDTNTTYTGSDGVTLNGTNFVNSGVRSVDTGSTNGTISVNINGTSADVSVKGLGDAAYKAASYFAVSDHTHNYAGSSSAGGVATSAAKLETAVYIDGVAFNGTANIAHFGTCSTAAATVAKVVACTGFALKTGAVINVKFSNAITVASATLNVNSTGAKAIYYRGAALPANIVSGGTVVKLVYNGTQYDMVGNWDVWVTD